MTAAPKVWSFESEVPEAVSEDGGDILVAYGVSDIDESEDHLPCPIYVHLLSSDEQSSETLPAHARPAHAALLGLVGKRVRITIEELESPDVKGSAS